jgi:hypothetical protein
LAVSPVDFSAVQQGLPKVEMAAREGNVLGGLPLTEGEKKGIEIAEETVQDLRIKGSKCLIGRLGVPKKLNKEAFKAVLMRIWRPAGKLMINEVQESLWLFEFEEDGDKRKVMAGRPWSYDRTLLILNEFDGRLAPSQMEFSCSPIWVQIHNMPLGCMNRAMGAQIGQTIGEVEDVAVAEDDVGWGRYLRVRVVINLFQPLERGRTLSISGSSCWVTFKYEKLPIFCFRCGCIIHGPKGCLEVSVRKPNHGEGSEGWGQWLRADDYPKRLGGNEGRKADPPSSPTVSDHRPMEEKSTEDFPEKESSQKAKNPENIDAHSNLESRFSGKTDVAGLHQYGNEERKTERRDMQEEKRKDVFQNPVEGVPVLRKGVAKGKKGGIKGGGSGENGKKKEYVRKTDLIAGSQKVGTGQMSDEGRPKVSLSQPRQPVRPTGDNWRAQVCSKNGSPQSPSGKLLNDIGPEKLHLAKENPPDTSIREILTQKDTSPPLTHYRKRKDREDPEVEMKLNGSPLEKPKSGGGCRSWKKLAREVANVTTGRGSVMERMGIEDVDRMESSEMMGTITKVDEGNSPVKTQFFDSPKSYELSTSKGVSLMAVAEEQPRHSP